MNKRSNEQTLSILGQNTVFHETTDHQQEETRVKQRTSPRKRSSPKTSHTLAILKKRNASPEKRLRVENDVDISTIFTSSSELKPKHTDRTNSVNGAHYSSTKRSPHKVNRGYKADVSSTAGFRSNGVTTAEIHIRAVDDCKSRQMNSSIKDLLTALKYPPLNNSTDFASSEHASEQCDEEIRKLDEEKEMNEVIDIAKRKRKISFSHQPKSESFAKQLVASIATRIPSNMELKKLKLRNCVTTKSLEIISRDFDSRKIRTLDLSGNKKLDLRVVERLRNKIQSEVLDLSDAELGAQEIVTLGEMKKVKELRINYKAFKHGSIAAALVKLINNGLEQLSLVDSNITDRQLHKIANGIKYEVSLRSLDLSHVTLKKMGVNAVVQIVNKSKGMDKLVLSNCAITTKLLKNFEKLVKHKVTELDVSSNDDLANGHLDVLSSLAAKVNCQALDISSISLDGNKIGELLKTTPPKHLEKLNMTENLEIDFVAVGELVTQWKILELDISECRPSSEAIVKLANSIGDHKLNSIDISDPMGIVNDEKRKALEALSGKTKNLTFGNNQEWP